jgi:hypothetical protein
MIQISRFWQFIANSRVRAGQLPLPPRTEFSRVHEQALIEMFREMSPEQIIAFEQRRRKLSAAAYRWDIWGAAYWYAGGCGDDAFENFRWNLIALGREWYDRILANPDDLADTIGDRTVPYMTAQWSFQPHRKAYFEKTGQELEAPLEFSVPNDPIGVHFDFDDRDLMRAKYPQLAAKLPNMGD